MSVSLDRREVAPPSGDQIEIAFGDQRAVVVEVGGGLRTYSADGHDVLDGYGVDERCPSGRGQLLIPWPNRIRDGQYDFDGQSHQLPLTEPELGNAIHGLVRWAAWEIGEREPSRVVMQHVIHPQPGYPFALALRVEYALSNDGLSVRTTATNVGADACPYGSGSHPYLTHGTTTIDRPRSAGAGAARAAPRRPGPARRLRTGRGNGVRLPGRPADRRHEARQCVHGPRTRPGWAGTRVPGGSRRPAGRVTLWVDEHYPYLMLFTGDPLPDVNRRALAVEPMTCPPNAFSTGDSVIRLQPGETATGVWGIEPAEKG